jgi:hypothetical protein
VVNAHPSLVAYDLIADYEVELQTNRGLDIVVNIFASGA